MIDYEELQRSAIRADWNQRNVIRRTGMILHKGSISSVFTVSGPCMITAAYMRIASAVGNVTCNMTWSLFPSDGATAIIFGAAVDIDNSALGDMYISVLDGGAIDKIATGSETQDFSDMFGISKRGLFAPDGTIRIGLTQDQALMTGTGDFYIEYTPILPYSKIWPGTMRSTTTTTSSTSSTTSSTSSTSSTTSSTTTTAP